MSKITNKDFQLFRLSPEIWKYTNLDDINQTFKDMMELDLDCAPYSNFAIEIKVIFINGLYHMDYVSEKEKNWTMLIEYEMEKFKVEDYIAGQGTEGFRNLFITIIDEHKKVLTKKANISNFIKNGKKFNIPNNLTEGGAEDMWYIACDCRAILLVMLATKNAKQEKLVNRDLLAGKHNKKNVYRKDYPYTTTISIGKITENYTNNGDDSKSVRPHLRRGHIRTQSFGPNRSFEKKIFIEPVFVNASEGWIGKRSAYNVSVGGAQ